MFKGLRKHYQNKDKEHREEEVNEELKEAKTQEYDPEKGITLKVTFVGEASVGAKTSFIMRYIKDEFTYSIEPTIGTAYSTKSIVSRAKKVEVQLWDTAGQERYLSLLPMYLRGADGIVVGYDIANRSSFETVRERYIDLKVEYPDAVVMLVGNKADLVECRNVSWDDGDELAEEIGADLFFETSAKTGYNVDESMEVFVDKILEKKGY